MKMVVPHDWHFVAERDAAGSGPSSTSTAMSSRSDSANRAVTTDYRTTEGGDGGEERALNDRVWDLQQLVWS